MQCLAPADKTRFSRLNDEGIYPPGWRLVSAFNTDVILECNGHRKRFTDLTSCYGAVNFGHCNPHIDAMATAPADIVASVYPPEADDLANWLCRRLDLMQHRVLYQVGGSFAVSSAIAMAQYHRPGKIAALKGAFHGLGLDTLGLTDIGRGTALQLTPWLNQIDGEIVRISTDMNTIDWNGISAFLFEPIQGANGYIPIDGDWLYEVTHAARKAGVTLISDEIQAGFYRHGYLSPTLNLGIQADIHLFSKSLSNGQTPLSAVVYDERLEEDFPLTHGLAHTYQSSVLNYRAGVAVSRYLDLNPQQDAITDIENRLQDVACKLKSIQGIENIYITGPTLSFGFPNREIRGEVIRSCFNEGIMILGGGADNNRIRIAPSLTIDLAQLNAATDQLIDTIRMARNHH